MCLCVCFCHWWWVGVFSLLICVRLFKFTVQPEERKREGGREREGDERTGEPDRKGQKTNGVEGKARPVAERGGEIRWEGGQPSEKMRWGKCRRRPRSQSQHLIPETARGTGQKKTASLQVGANTHDAHHVFVGAPLHPLGAIMEGTPWPYCSRTRTHIEDCQTCSPSIQLKEKFVSLRDGLEAISNNSPHSQTYWFGIDLREKYQIPSWLFYRSKYFNLFELFGCLFIGCKRHISHCVAAVCAVMRFPQTPLLHRDKDISYSRANYLIHKPFSTDLFHPSK